MRTPLTFLASLLLASNFGGAQQPSSNESCGYTVQGKASQATVVGPDDIVPLVYVVERPDSPLEIVSADRFLRRQGHRRCPKQSCASARLH